jgi:hypothetical protein
MDQHPAAVRLRDMLAGASSDFGAVLSDQRRQEELRHQVCSVVDHLREIGWPAERIIVALKQIAKEAGLAPSLSLTKFSDPLTDSDALLVRLVRWGIDHHFDTTVGFR